MSEVTFILDLGTTFSSREPCPTNRSLRATYQIRCGGCGRFAKVVRSGSGEWGDDSWWDVECKKCGSQEGYSGPL